MSQIKTTLIAAFALVAISSSAQAQFSVPKPFKNTPLDPGTYKPGNLIKKPNDDSTFHHVPTTQYNIMARGKYEGWLFYGKKRVRRAQLVHKGTKAYYYDSKTRTQARAPHRDRKSNSVSGSSSNSGNIQFGSTQVKARYHISNTGRVTYGKTSQGTAKRVRFRSGKTGWYKLVSANRIAYRYDGSSRTSTTYFGNLGRL